MSWIQTLNDDAQQRAYAAMQRVQTLSCNLDPHIKYPTFRSGDAVEVGSEGRKVAIKTEAIAAFIRAICNGATPSEALTQSETFGRTLVAAHNKERPKDAHWQLWEGCCDSILFGAFCFLRDATDRVVLNAKK